MFITYKSSWGLNRNPRIRISRSTFLCITFSLLNNYYLRHFHCDAFLSKTPLLVSFMGREWLYWIGGAGAGFPRRRRRTSAGTSKEDDTSSPGCMCAVFHLFDLHHIHLPLNHQHSLPPFLQQESTSSKGLLSLSLSLNILC